MKIDFVSDNLTKHFKASEAIKTSHGPNTPTDERIIRNIRLTAHNMEMVRLYLGDRGITPTSWYRSPKVNEAVGGSPTSSHRDGGAVDFKHAVYNNKEVYNILSTPEAKEVLGYDQLIYYPNKTVCHIGWRYDGRPNRKEHFVKK